MPRNDDQFVLDQAGDHGYLLVGMGVKEIEPDEYKLCYLFEHGHGGTNELYRYYVWEMACIPSDFEYASKVASEAAERHKVPYYGKLPEGSDSGDDAIWEESPEGLEDEPEGSAISEARRTAEIAFQFYTNRHQAKATESLTVLLMQMQSLFGHSDAFFQVFSVLDEVKVAIEQEDFESGKAPLLAVLVKLRQVEAKMRAGEK